MPKPSYLFATVALSLCLSACAAVETEDFTRPSAANWPSNGGDWAHTRYSPLDQVNRDTVKQLGGAWMTPLKGATSKAAPIIRDGKIYIAVTGGAIYGGSGGGVYALDARTGAVDWSFASDAGGVSALNKGVAVGEGKVFVGLANAQVAALDAKNGKPLWTASAGHDPLPPGEFISAAPVYADGLVIVGLASGDAGIRGRLVALDAKTGKVAWFFETVPGPGEKGHETWPQDNNAWERGGAGVWATAAIDKELGLVIFGTGNAFPQYGPEVRPGDNLFSASAVALDLKTGKYRWHFQTVHHEMWESDLGAPMLLFDADFAGKPRKAVAVLRMDGYIFMLDRATGQPILPVEERPVKQNARLKTAPTQPFPVGADQLAPNCVDKAMIPVGFEPACFWDPVDYDQPNIMVPSAARFAPMSYDPEAGLIYVTGGVNPSWRRRAEDPYFFLIPSVPGVKSYGILAAYDARTSKLAWKKQLPHPVSFGGGTTATAGGLLFHGEPDGNLQAYDSRGGELLWQFQTGGPINGPIATHAVDGKQHVVAVAGDRVWSFAVGGALQPVPAGKLGAGPEAMFAGRIVSTDKVTMAAELQNVNVAAPGAKFKDEYAFQPARIKVKAGTTVTWTNAGTKTHEASAQDGSWTTGPIAPGKTGAVTFSKPGTYQYICKEHPFSFGQLIVE